MEAVLGEFAHDAAHRSVVVIVAYDIGFRGARNGGLGPGGLDCRPCGIRGGVLRTERVALAVGVDDLAHVGQRPYVGRALGVGAAFEPHLAGVDLKYAGLDLRAVRTSYHILRHGAEHRREEQEE